MKRFLAYAGVTLTLLALGLVVTAQIDLIPFTAGEVIRAEEVNQNFQSLAEAIEAGQLPAECEAGEVAEWDGSSWVCAQDDVGEGGGGGDITAVVAGEGLTGGGLSGEVSLRVDFDGSGSASSVARSDHLHDERYYTEAEVDEAIAAAALPGAEAITTAGISVPATLTVQTSFTDINETFTSTQDGKLLVGKFFSGSLTCMETTGRRYFITVDGEPVRSSMIYRSSSDPSFSGMLTGVTESRVPAGEHVLGIGGQCGSGGIAAFTLVHMSIGSVVVLPD